MRQVLARLEAEEHRATGVENVERLLMLRREAEHLVAELGATEGSDRVTQSPHYVRLVGQLDHFEESSGQWTLLLDTGEAAAGIYVGTDLLRGSELLGRRVVAGGRAEFRGSEFVRLLAEWLSPSDEGSYFSRVPALPRLITPPRIPDTPHPDGTPSWVGSIPFDESEDEEEFWKMVEEMS